ncbi:MAG TPA: CvpA family protein [Chloroflexota bacterium]|nr:CvpA family protein [Chloroflexota bacterium]
MLENWVDVIIIFLLVVYALQGLQRGFILGLLDLAGLLLALFVALQYYPSGVALLSPYVPLPDSLLKPIAFLGLWLLSDILVTLLLRLVGLPLRLFGRFSSLNGLLGIVPGLLKGGLVVALVLALALALPLPEPVRGQITGSAAGGRLAGELGPLEDSLREVFADAVLSGIAVATVHPQADERVELQFSGAAGRVDEEAETRMLKLLNDARAQAGLPPLKADPQLTEAARAHSRDMLAKGYFAHQDDDGKRPADRVSAAGVRWAVVGENLALAPTVDVAHQGLMNSPGHRENILSPQYHRVGIGVVDGGLHGKMFTQDFAD